MAGTAVHDASESRAVPPSGGVGRACGRGRGLGSPGRRPSAVYMSRLLRLSGEYEPRDPSLRDAAPDYRRPRRTAHRTAAGSADAGSVKEKNMMSRVMRG